MQVRTISICLLSVTALVLALPSVGVLTVNAHLCGSSGTIGIATFNPAPGKYVEVDVYACGVGSPTFTSETHKIVCSTSSPSSDWSFGSGSYEYYAFKSGGHPAYDHLTNTNGVCPNNTTVYGSVGAIQMYTDGSLFVTYVPTGANTTLSASASDCVASSCPN
jgi:hypothetical protein